MTSLLPGVAVPLLALLLLLLHAVAAEPDMTRLSSRVRLAMGKVAGDCVADTAAGAWLDAMVDAAAPGEGTVQTYLRGSVLVMWSAQLRHQAATSVCQAATNALRWRADIPRASASDVAQCVAALEATGRDVLANEVYPCLRTYYKARLMTTAASIHIYTHTVRPL